MSRCFCFRDFLRPEQRDYIDDGSCDGQGRSLSHCEYQFVFCLRLRAFLYFFAQLRVVFSASTPLFILFNFNSFFSYFHTSFPSLSLVRGAACLFVCLSTFLVFSLPLPYLCIRLQTYHSTCKCDSVHGKYVSGADTVI